MKKTLLAGLLSIFLGVSILFTGCGTDLSGINSQINELKQQIASLTQTILELQNRLSQSEENQQQLLLDLTTAQGKLLTLEEQINGKVHNYYKINETITYSVNGIKLLDFTPTSTIITGAHLVYYTTTNYEVDFDLLNEKLNFSAYLYDKETQTSHTVFNINETRIAFSSSVPENLDNGLMYLYINGTIWGIYELNFD